MTKRPGSARTVILWCLAVIAVAFGAAGASLASTSSSKLTKIEFRTGFGIGGWDAGYFVALRKGYYRQAGLDVTIKGGLGSFSNVQLAAAGKADIVHAASPALIAAISQEAKIKMIASFVQVGGSGVATKPEIRTVQDLAGKTFWGTAFDYTSQLLPTYLKLAGIDPKSVKQELAQFGDPIATFQTGRYDMVTANGWAEVPEMKALGIKFNFFPFGKAGLNFVGPGLVVNNGWLASHRAAARAFALASARGWQYAETHPPEAAAIMKSVNKSLNVAQTILIQKTFPGYNYTPTTKGQALGRMSGVDWQNTVSALLKGGLLKAELPIASLYENIIPANSPYRVTRRGA
jgi:NitT/TauT family transport system substrate-binding protein